MYNNFHFNTDFGDMSEDAAEGWKSVLMRQSSALERLCQEAVSTYRAIVDDIQINYTQNAGQTLMTMNMTSVVRSQRKEIRKETTLFYFVFKFSSSSLSLQRVVQTAQNITNQQFPALDDIINSHCLQKTHSILKDPSHTAHQLFELMPSRKCYRSMKT